MTSEIKAIIEKMLESYVCPELREAAEAFLGADGTDAENAAREKLVAVLPDSIASIDDAIAFAKSDFAKEKFGEEGAAAFLKEICARKEAGEIYCGCPGCQAALRLMDALR